MKYRITKNTKIICALLFINTLYCKAEAFNRDSLNIPEVVVTGSRNEVDIRHLPMNVSTINESQIEKREEQSLLPLLVEQVPSLFITSRGVMGYGVSTGSSGGMTMRGIGGSPTTGMLVLIDGHPQYMGLMGHPIADAYQSMLAQRVEVVRGPASVLYGSNAMGGVINILTKQQKDNGFKGHIKASYGSYNTVNSDATLRYRYKGFSALASGSYNRTDGHRPNMEFEQYGGFAKAGYEFNKHWNLFADVNITHFNAQNPGTISRPIYHNDSHITRGMASISLENSYQRTSGAFKAFYNWGRHIINDGYYEGGAPRDYLFNSQDLMLGINWYQSVILWQGSRVTAGVDYQHFGGIAWNSYIDGSENQIIDKSLYNIAGYIDYRQSIANIITLNAGLRFDHHSVTGNHWIPQFGASIYPIQTGEIKLIASRGFRNPTIREMYMFPPQNPNLQPESLWNYDISWTQRLFKGSFMYGVNLYYINGKNMIQTVPVDGRMMNINTGAIKNYGIELQSALHFLKMFTLNANYSWLHMKNPILASPEHKLYVGLDFEKGRWFASTGVQYINGLYTALDPQEREQFVLWNIRGSFAATKWLELFVKAENLLNQQYEINKGFPMPGITAMGGVKFKF